MHLQLKENGSLEYLNSAVVFLSSDEPGMEMQWARVEMPTITPSSQSQPLVRIWSLLDQPDFLWEYEC